jgi:hypothetical protein
MIKTISQTVEGMLIAAAEVIMSPVQAEEWEVLRESLGDPALLAIEASTYRRHMQLVAAQLLQGAVAQAMGGPAMFMSDPMTAFDKLQLVKQLVAEKVHGVEPVARDYNGAYGDPAGQWASKMVQVFEANTCGDKMRAPTVDVIARYWQSLLVSYREKFARVL